MLHVPFINCFCMLTILALWQMSAIEMSSDSALSTHNTSSDENILIDNWRPDVTGKMYKEHNPLPNVDDEKLQIDLCSIGSESVNQNDTTEANDIPMNQVDLQIYLWNIYHSEEYWIDHFTNDIDTMLSTQNTSYYKNFEANTLPINNKLKHHEIQKIKNTIQDVSLSLPYLVEMAILETAIRVETLNTKYNEISTFMRLKKTKQYDLALALGQQNHLNPMNINRTIEIIHYLRIIFDDKRKTLSWKPKYVNIAIKCLRSLYSSKNQSKIRQALRKKWDKLRTFRFFWNEARRKPTDILSASNFGLTQKYTMNFEIQQNDSILGYLGLIVYHNKELMHTTESNSTNIIEVQKLAAKLKSFGEEFVPNHPNNLMDVNFMYNTLHALHESKLSIHRYATTVPIILNTHTSSKIHSKEFIKNTY
eukprot:467822_1